MISVGDSVSLTGSEAISDGSLSQNGLVLDLDGRFGVETDTGAEIWVAQAFVSIPVITDGNFEASGTSAWTPQNNAVLSKELGTRTGGLGIRVLRVTGDGATAYPLATQELSGVVDGRLEVFGWVRGDGTNAPYMRVWSEPVYMRSVLDLGVTPALWLDSDVGVTTRDDAGTLYVIAWADRMGNVDVAQAMASDQPVYNGVGGGITLDGVDDYLVSNVVKSTLAYLHQEATVFVALARTDEVVNSAPIRTCGLNNSQIGFMFHSHPATSLKLIVANGSGTSYSVSENGSGYTTDSHIIGYTLDADGAYIRLDGSVIASEVPLLAPTSSGDPNYDLEIGKAANFFGGTIYEIIAFDRKLTDSEIEKVERYLSNRWDIPVPVGTSSTDWQQFSMSSNVSGSVFCTFGSDTASGTGWAEFDDIVLSRQSPVVYQPLADNQPSYDGTDLTFDGTDDSAPIILGFGNHTTHHIFAIVSLTDLTGSDQFLLDGETGRLTVGFQEVSGELRLGYFEGSTWQATGTTDVLDSGLILVEYQLEAGVGGVCRLNSVDETTLQSYTGTSFGSTVMVGSRYDGTLDGFLKGSVRRVSAYNRILTAGERNYIYSVARSLGVSM